MKKPACLLVGWLVYKHQPLGSALCGLDQNIILYFIISIRRLWLASSSSIYLRYSNLTSVVVVIIIILYNMIIQLITQPQQQQQIQQTQNYSTLSEPNWPSSAQQTRMQCVRCRWCVYIYIYTYTCCVSRVLYLCK